LAFAHIRTALASFSSEAGITVSATVPVSALKGWNVVEPAADVAWCGYRGPTLIKLLEQLPVTPTDTGLPLAFPVQWVEKFSSSADTHQGRRILWGRVATGRVQPGQLIRVMPSGQTAQVAQVLDHVRHPQTVAAGHSAGIVLDRELDVSRGDWLMATSDGGVGLSASQTLQATVAWLDDDALTAGRIYWALHGHRWVKARVQRIVHRLNIHTLAEENATQLEPNDIGHIELALQEPLTTLPFEQSRALGSLVLVDTASHRTAGALLVR
jgi:sulfate adenylyltransferase subunit 1